MIPQKIGKYNMEHEVAAKIILIFVYGELYYYIIYIYIYVLLYNYLPKRKMSIFNFAFSDQKRNEYCLL